MTTEGEMVWIIFQNAGAESRRDLEMRRGAARRPFVTSRGSVGFYFFFFVAFFLAAFFFAGIFDLPPPSDDRDRIAIVVSVTRHRLNIMGV